MIGAGYLEKGLWGLSRAHLVSPMVGHPGGALVAGYLFSADHPDLPREARESSADSTAPVRHDLARKLPPTRSV